MTGVQTCALPISLLVGGSASVATCFKALLVGAFAAGLLLSLAIRRQAVPDPVPASAQP